MITIWITGFEDEKNEWKCCMIERKLYKWGERETTYLDPLIREKESDGWIGAKRKRSYLDTWNREKDRQLDWWVERERGKERLSQ